MLPKAETVYSGSVEPDQVKTCEGNKSKRLICISLFGLAPPITAVIRLLAITPASNSAQANTYHLNRM